MGSSIPSVRTSNDTEDFKVHALFGEHLCELLDQWTQPMLGPVWNVFMKHQSLAKQPMRPILHRVRLQSSVIAQALPRRAEQGQQCNRQRAEQQHAVTTLRSLDAHRRHPHAESHVLDVSKARLGPPAIAIVMNSLMSPRRNTALSAIVRFRIGSKAV